MAKSSADDEELRRACAAAVEGTKEKILMSIRVAKSRGVWGKTGNLGRQMAKARVLALSTKAKVNRTKAFLRVLKYSNGDVLEENTPTVSVQLSVVDGPVAAAAITENDLKVTVEKDLVSQVEEEDMEALLGFVMGIGEAEAFSKDEAGASSSRSSKCTCLFGN